MLESECGPCRTAVGDMLIQRLFSRPSREITQYMIVIVNIINTYIYSQISPGATSVIPG